MTEARPFASLSGSLLARKGGAKPAMRPRPIGSGGMLDDLGWNDMGYAPEQPAEHVPSSIAGLTPAPRAQGPREEQPPVHLQQRALADHFPAPEPAPEPEVEPEAADAEPIVLLSTRPAAKVVAMPKRPAAAQGRKSAFTLRLDQARHLRLRLATAVTGQSAQQLVTGALDNFLETLPEVGTLAEQLPARSTKRS